MRTKEKKLNRLSRAELLELLLAQTQETERLQQELQQAKLRLEERDLKIRQAGNLAEAALAVNDVMETAQKAAQQYLDNIAAMEEAARAECEQLIAEARQEARRICMEAAISTEETDEELIHELHEILDEENE